MKQFFVYLLSRTGLDKLSELNKNNWTHVLHELSAKIGMLFFYCSKESDMQSYTVKSFTIINGVHLLSSYVCILLEKKYMLEYACTALKRHLDMLTGSFSLIFGFALKYSCSSEQENCL